MKIIILMVLGLLIGVLDSTLKNIFSRNYAKGLCDIVLFSALILFAASAGLAVMGGMQIPGAYASGLALAYGVNMIVSMLCSMEAMKRGPLAPNTVITTTMSSAIPCLLGVVVFQETVSKSQLLGVVLMLFSCILTASQTAKKDAVPVQKGWLFFVLINGLSGGMFGVIQKVFNKVCLPEENSIFLFYGLFLSAVFTTVFFLILRKKTAPWKKAVNFSFKSLVPVLALTLGVLTAADNVHNLWLTGQLPSVVFFVIINGGRMILIALVSRLFFKEKLSGKQFAGFITGVLAVILLSGLL